MKRMRLIFYSIAVIILICCQVSCDGRRSGGQGGATGEKPVSVAEVEEHDEGEPVYALLILPANPAPGKDFSVLATGGKNLRKAKILVTGPSGELDSEEGRIGEESPYWRIDNFRGSVTGKYKASLVVKNKEVSSLEFILSSPQLSSPKGTTQPGKIWKTSQGWDSKMETLYSVWINALFQHCDEQSSWSSLHVVTQDKERNFLYNYLGLGEDDPESKASVIMEPDCADNPFFLRAYFAWKLGLPFGFHVCDRGWVGRSPRTGQWVTNESGSSKSNPVLAFNSFMRRVMDGVHSGTARTALDDNSSDYYPVPLDRDALRPGTVFADPYGHTLVIISWKPQTKDHPGLLLAVDAQPDNTIAVKRFWKGNFLFNTAEVVGEPGFKAFRPVSFENGRLIPIKNEMLKDSAGYIPYSLEQRKMGIDDFYLAMERLINPEPLDPEEALDDLIRALHEQLQVRVKSVANGEAYLKAHPGTVISMPSSANGVFLASGLWEDYSTPNRDLRLLIAIDAVAGFPDHVAAHPEDFNISRSRSPEDIRNKLQSLLDEKVAELTITYSRSDGSPQELTIAEILSRRDAFEMAYNPNDCVEIRWGAPEGSTERSTCHRQVPAYQQKTMQSVRKWFAQRLHPPT